MTDDSDTQGLAPRRRVATGPRRPDYLGNADLDKTMMIMTAFMGEFSALRDRLDTHEQLARAGTCASPEAIEAFRPSEADEQRRSDQRQAFFDRVFRVLFEELEQAGRAEPGEAVASPAD
jgi:hypothetical protein